MMTPGVQSKDLEKAEEEAEREEEVDEEADDADDDAAADPPAGAEEEDEDEAHFEGQFGSEAWIMASLVSEGARAACGRERIRIPETVLFESGEPVCWLFCDRRGRLKRKHSHRLDWHKIRTAMMHSRKQQPSSPEEDSEEAAPVCVLRWRPVGSVETAATLLDWRELRDLEHRKPARCGSGLKSRDQFVALQPLISKQQGVLKSGVFLHGLGEQKAVPGWPAQLETRELMQWPLAEPRGERRVAISSMLVRDDRTKAIMAVAERVARRVEATSERVESFVGEFVFDCKGRCFLTFAHHVSHQGALTFAAKKQAGLSRFEEAALLLRRLDGEPFRVERFSTKGIEAFETKKELGKTHRSSEVAIPVLTAEQRKMIAGALMLPTPGKRAVIDNRSIGPERFVRSKFEIEMPVDSAKVVQEEGVPLTFRKPRPPKEQARRHPFGLDATNRSMRILRSNLTHILGSSSKRGIAQPTQQGSTWLSLVP